MAGTVQSFYDELSSNYHLIFEDWETSMAKQSAVLGPILARASSTAMPLTILDCACGIGTQALGLARNGFRVTGTDLSPRAIERARREASARSLNLHFHVADMLRLNRVPQRGFDAVICIDNSLPHFSSEEDLTEAATQMRKKLRPGGIFAASIRDYDHLIEERPSVQPHASSLMGPDVESFFNYGTGLMSEDTMFICTSLGMTERVVGKLNTPFPPTEPCFATN